MNEYGENNASDENKHPDTGKEDEEEEVEDGEGERERKKEKSG